MKYPYGKTILITGASSGIGLACADHFVRAGYRVIGASRHPQCLVEKVHESGGTYIPLHMDVTDETSVKAAFAQLDEQGLLPGIVLHCAGIGIAGAAEDTPIADLIRQLETNLFGVMRVNAALLPHMRRMRRGLVLAVGSMAGRVTLPFQSFYSISKIALETYIEALRLEMKPHGVAACSILPGDTATNFTKSREIHMPDGPPHAARCVRAVAYMEKDEMQGRSPQAAARLAVKLCGRRRVPVRVTVGTPEKLMMAGVKLLPARMVHLVVTRKYLK